MKKIKEIITRVKNKLTSKINERFIKEAIAVSSFVKRVVESDFVKFVTSVSAPEWDNNARVAADLIFSEVLDVLLIVDKCNQGETYEERLNCFVKQIKEMHPEYQKMVYQQIAAWFLRKKLAKDNKVVYNAEAVRAIEKQFV